MEHPNYRNPAFPSSFAGFRNFYRALKKNGYKGQPKILRDRLSYSKPYTYHYPRRKNFPRNKVIVNGIDHTWQMDLADFQRIAKHNDGFRYLLIVIDVFSKFVAVEPTIDKQAGTMRKALQSIFKRIGRKPDLIQSDEGGEFVNRTVLNFLNAEGVRHYIIKSDKKACVVERVIRTLKERIFRYFTFTGTQRYINHLQDFVDSYNNSYHRTIKMTPNEVTVENEKDIWSRVFMYKPTDIVRFKLRIGDRVRVVVAAPTFEKGYTQKWSNEIFTVIEREARVPPIYKIKDSNNEEIDGTYYDYELQKVQFWTL